MNSIKTKRLIHVHWSRLDCQPIYPLSLPPTILPFFEFFLLLYTLLFIRLLRSLREALIEAPSQEKRKPLVNIVDNLTSGSALDSCQRCHFLLTNHKVGWDLQFVDRAGWVSSRVLTNKILGKEKRGAFPCLQAVKIKHVRAVSVNHL